MLAWARWFWLSRYGYLLLALLFFGLSNVALSVCCTVKSHVSTSASRLEDGLDGCESHRGKDVAVRHVVLGDFSSNHVHSNLQEGCDPKNLHRNLEQFCFQSTFNVSGKNDGVALSSDVSQCQDGNSSECGRPHKSGENFGTGLDNSSFKLLDGRLVSCSVGSLPDALGTENTDSFGITTSRRLSHKDNCRHKFVRTSSTWGSDGHDVDEFNTLSSVTSPKVLVSPPFLDWELNYLLSPSFSFLTITNMHNDIMLHVYEPFSTDPQFYVYGFEEKLLMPGENTTITFIFLPKVLGYSSSNLILQTSVGGFIIHAKGEAVESPYRVHPIVYENQLAKKSPRKLSLYNPFDIDLHVVEITAWFEATIGNATHSVHATCQRVEAHDGFSSSLPDDNGWMTVRSIPFGLPLLQIRTSKLWQIEPRKGENVVELNLLLPAEVEVLGNICVSLCNSSCDQIQRIVVPFEAEKFSRVFYSDFRGSSTVLLESLVGNGSEHLNVFSLSMKNDASYSLKVDEIREVTDGMEHFHIKYLQGLILIPETLTRVANLIYHPYALFSEDVAAEVPNGKPNCNLLILTNDTVSPQIEIPCEVVFDAFSRHEIESTTTGVDESTVITKSENSTFSSSGTQIFSSLIKPQLSMKDLDIAESDKWFLSNWRSQRTEMGMSILDDLEMLFPITQVGTHCSKLIAVKNPSQKPVTMQLVLNSRAVIDQCVGFDDLSKNGSSTQYELSTERDGFLVADGGITELYIYPNESASLGPIMFHPSSRGVWRSFALIRNNLTGLELLRLHAAGGFASLVLLEGSKPIEKIEFNFSLPLPLNASPPERFLDMKSTSGSCTRPLLKILFAKNAGDVPIEVKQIDVSGIGCGSDGFMVDPCGDFVLQPGESMRLLVSYQTDFSVPVVHRDLELALSTGILVIPMTVTFPSYMLSLCRNSFFWMILRKVSLVILVAASATVLIFYRNIPQSTAAEGQEYLYRDEKRAISSITRIGKQCHSRQTSKNFRVATTHPTEAKFGVQSETHKNQESETLSPHQLGWMQDNRVSSTLSSYNEDYKKTRLSSCYSASSSKHIKDGSGLPESPKMSSLTVRTEKEKGRRRKKRGVLAAKHDVSSSQSGNSTPSSPVSPLTPFTSYCPDSPHDKTSLPTLQPNVEATEVPEYTLTETSAVHSANISSETVMFYHDKVLLSNPVPGSVSSGEPLNMSRRASLRPAPLPPATFPSNPKPNTRTVCKPSFLASSPSSPCLSQSSVIAPHARAPGSRRGKESAAKEENENDVLYEGLAYDIWGNHFPEFQLLDKPGSFSSKMFDMSPDSHSLFTETPWTHLQKFLF